MPIGLPIQPRNLPSLGRAVIPGDTLLVSPDGLVLEQATPAELFGAPDGTLSLSYSFGNVAALVAAATPSLSTGRTLVAYLEGYYTPGDGGGGTVYWSSTSTATADNGLVFNPTGNVGTGRWLRFGMNSLSPPMFGAKGDGTTNNTSFLTAMFSAVTTSGIHAVLIPDGTFLSGPLINIIPTNTRITGASWNASLKYNSPGTANFIDCSAGGVGIIFENLTLDGGYTSLTTTTGWTLAFGNLGNFTFQPLANNCKAINCQIKSNGFGGIVLGQSGYCEVDSCLVTGAPDTAIAIIAANWGCKVTNNTTTTSQFGISMSSDGFQHATACGFNVGNTIIGNTCFATRASSYGYEFDGCQGCVISDNVAVVNGGGWGFRFEVLLLSSGGHGDINVPFQDNTVANNNVQMVQDIGATAYEIFSQAAFDATTNSFNNNIAWALAPQANTLGYLIDGGCSVRLTNPVVNNAGHIGIQFQQNNIVGVTFELIGALVRGCQFGLYCGSTDANIATVIVANSDINGSSSENITATTGTSLTLNNTPAHTPSSVVPASYHGDAIVTVSPSLVPGAIANGAQYFVGGVSYLAPNAVVGATVDMAWGADLNGCLPLAVVPAAGVVHGFVINLTGGTVTLAGSFPFTFRTTNP